MSSSSKEEDKENSSCSETFEEENIAAREEAKECDKPKAALENSKQQEEVCVPDSSNNEPEEEPALDESQEEQHSSGSVDEELLEEDDTMDTGESKTAEEENPEPSDGKDAETEKEVAPSKHHSLVGELMNKFGFNDILEYQEAYRKAVQESRGANDLEADNNNEEETNKATNGLKLRSDITIDPERNLTDLSKSDILRNFETLKRLRPELGGAGQERETLFAGEWTQVNPHILSDNWKYLHNQVYGSQQALVPYLEASECFLEAEAGSEAVAGEATEVAGDLYHSSLFLLCPRASICLP